MKKGIIAACCIALLAGVSLAGQSAKADAALKQAMESAMSRAVPLASVPTVLDSKGCLWGLGEENGIVKAVRVADDAGKSYCQATK